MAAVGSKTRFLSQFVYITRRCISSSVSSHSKIENVQHKENAVVSQDSLNQVIFAIILPVDTLKFEILNCNNSYTPFL